MMMVYAHGMKFFLARGIESFTYVGRQEDDSVTLFGQELYRRRIRYAFRLSFLVNYEAKDLELIHVAAHMGPANESPISEFEWSLGDGSKPQR
jgi:hypothetical protein